MRKATRMATKALSQVMPFASGILEVAVVFDTKSPRRVRPATLEVLGPLKPVCNVIVKLHIRDVSIDLIGGQPPSPH